jgi:hypothetical protein
MTAKAEDHMTIAPVFEECAPAHDRLGAVAVRRRHLPCTGGGRPVGRSTLRALALVAAAGLALTGAGPGSALAGPSAAGAVARPPRAPQPPTPQGGAGPLQGAPVSDTGADGPTALTKTTRAEIIARAKTWVDAKVPYSMTAYWSDGYRQDCSGYVSMAWGLPGNEWTGSLAQFGVKITRDQLAPGDILLFHNPDDPTSGSHVTLFGGWADAAHKTYLAYEQTPPHARAQATPMAYWTDSDKYVPYRYKDLSDAATTGPVTGFPGAQWFGPGANNPYVTRLGAMLSGRGGKRYYRTGPGPVWSEADRRATRAFQRAQGWRGKEADGLPGPDTWHHLVTHHGKDIPRPPAVTSHHGRQTGTQAAPAGSTAHRPDPGAPRTDADRAGNGGRG